MAISNLSKMGIDWILMGLLAVNFVLATASDSLSKMWATHPGSKWAFIVIGLSILTTVSWMLVVRRSGLAVGSAIMLLLTMLSTVLIGLFIFKEHITRGQALGLAFGFIAALFLLKVVRI